MGRHEFAEPGVHAVGVLASAPTRGARARRAYDPAPRGATRPSPRRPRPPTRPRERDPPPSGRASAPRRESRWLIGNSSPRGRWLRHGAGWRRPSSPVFPIRARTGDVPGLVSAIPASTAITDQPSRPRRDSRGRGTRRRRARELPPRSRPRARDSGTRPTSSPSRMATPRCDASRTTRSTTSCSGERSRSRTFMLTWTRPSSAAESDRLHARHPAARFTDDGRDLTRDSDVVRGEVDVVCDQGRPRAYEDCSRAGIESARAGVGDELARVETAAELCEAACAGRTTAVCRRPLRRTGRPEASSSAPIRSATALRRDLAASMPSGAKGTSGTTSTAPTRGWTPDCSRRSMSPTAREMPARSDSTSELSSPTNVNTERW